MRQYIQSPARPVLGLKDGEYAYVNLSPGRYWLEFGGEDARYGLIHARYRHPASDREQEMDGLNLFTNPKTGTRIKDYKREFLVALKDAGIRDFRFHDLKHTFGKEPPTQAHH